MQCACAVLSFVVCPALLYFSTLSHKRHDIRGKKSYWKPPPPQNVWTEFLTTFACNIYHSKKKINHTFCKHNTKQNSKKQVPTQLWSGHVRREMGKSERVWRTGIPSHSRWSNRLLMLCCTVHTHCTVILTAMLFCFDVKNVPAVVRIKDDRKVRTEFEPNREIVREN